MKKSSLIFVLLFTSLFSISGPAFATCDIGTVVFRNTLYGTAGGAGLGALYLIAKSKTEDVTPTVATAGLIGAGVGAGIGAAQIYFSNCMNAKEDSDNYKIHMKPLVNVAEDFIGGGIFVAYDLD